MGKTNIAINLALAYAKAGKRVIVMDADLGLANVNVVLGVIPRYNLYHLIRKQKTLSEILVDTNYGIQIIAGASGFSKIANLSEEERRDFIGELAALSNADILIIDCAAGVSNNVISFIAAADDAIIVTTPEPTAITDAYGIIKIIATEIENLDLGLKLVVNRVKSVVEGKRVAERVINIAGQFLNLKVDYLGFVFDDPVVAYLGGPAEAVLHPGAPVPRFGVHPPPCGSAGELRLSGREGDPGVPQEAVRRQMKSGRMNVTHRRMLTLCLVSPTVSEGGSVR